jgi:2-oxoglutarate dehydrogenase E1 component
VLDLYDRYTHDPASVDADTRAFFDSWSSDHAENQQERISLPAAQPTNYDVTSGEAVLPQVSHIVAASALAHAIRERGHLGADLDPLGKAALGDPALLPEYYGLTDEDLVKMPLTRSKLLTPCARCILARLAMSSIK